MHADEIQILREWSELVAEREMEEEEEASAGQVVFSLTNPVCMVLPKGPKRKSATSWWGNYYTYNDSDCSCIFMGHHQLDVTMFLPSDVWTLWL